MKRISPSAVARHIATIVEKIDGVKLSDGAVGYIANTVRLMRGSGQHELLAQMKEQADGCWAAATTLREMLEESETPAVLRQAQDEGGSESVAASGHQEAG